MMIEIKDDLKFAQFVKMVESYIWGSEDDSGARAKKLAFAWLNHAGEPQELATTGHLMAWLDQMWCKACLDGRVAVETVPGTIQIAQVGIAKAPSLPGLIGSQAEINGQRRWRETSCRDARLVQM